MWDILVPLAQTLGRRDQRLYCLFRKTQTMWDARNCPSFETSPGLFGFRSSQLTVRRSKVTALHLDFNAFVLIDFMTFVFVIEPRSSQLRVCRYVGAFNNLRSCFISPLSTVDNSQSPNAGIVSDPYRE